MSNKATLISPYFPENIAHNRKTVQTIRNVASLAIGVGAGILQLESYHGFLFYFLCSLVISVLLYIFVAKGAPKDYFYSPLSDIWIDEVFPGLASFVLMWTLFYGLVDA